MNGDGVSEGGLSKGITQGEGNGSSGSEVDVPGVGSSGNIASDGLENLGGGRTLVGTDDVRSLSSGEGDEVRLASEETSGRSVDLLSRDEGSNEGDKSDGGELEHD